jgi:hypothetical protein
VWTSFPDRWLAQTRPYFSSPSRIFILLILP